MKILFWNTNNKDLTSELAELASLRRLDIIILCEYSMDDFRLLKKLNSKKKQGIYKVSNCVSCEKIKIFTKINLSLINVVQESKRWTIRKIEHVLYETFLLVAVHLPSKVNFSDSDQLLEATVFRDSIDKAKKNSNIDKIIIVGDLNMNPYEEGIISTKGLHATSDKKIAMRVRRTVQENEYEYYYNPMWNFLGDDSKGEIPGTFYFKGSNHTCINWNIFDQLLISPKMIEYISNNEIEIITKSKNFNLIKENGKIESEKYSDHLPIQFEIYSNKI